MFYVRIRFEFLTQKMDGLRLKKPKTMNLQRGLENWTKMSWTTNKVDSNDKNRKID